MANIAIPMVVFTRAHGKMTYRVDKAARLSPKARPTRVNSTKARDMARVGAPSPITVSTLGSGKTVWLMERARWTGVMGASITDSGRRIGCMDRAATCTTTVSPTRGPSITTASMGTGCTGGLMDGSMTASGSTASSTAALSTPTARAWLARASGRRVSG